jgi:hypothetical protein
MERELDRLVAFVRQSGNADDFTRLKSAFTDDAVLVGYLRSSLAEAMSQTFDEVTVQKELVLPWSRIEALLLPEDPAERVLHLLVAEMFAEDTELPRPSPPPGGTRMDGDPRATRDPVGQRTMTTRTSRLPRRTRPTKRARRRLRRNRRDRRNRRTKLGIHATGFWGARGLFRETSHKARDAHFSRATMGGMAKNTGSGHRKGSVKARSQTQTSSGHYVKRDAISGRFLEVKKDQSPFKGVRREKKG